MTAALPSPRSSRSTVPAAAAHRQSRHRCGQPARSRGNGNCGSPFASQKSIRPRSPSPCPSVRERSDDESSAFRRDRGLAARRRRSPGSSAVAAPASAHVTVNPRKAMQGGYAPARVPGAERERHRGTVKLEVHLPENAPVASVSTMPVPGWTVTIEKRKLDQPIEVHGSQITEVVSKITWTANGGRGASSPGSSRSSRCRWARCRRSTG